MNTAENPDSWAFHPPLGQPSVDAGPLGYLPSLSRRRVRLERRLGLGGPIPDPLALVAEFSKLVGVDLEPGRLEIQWRGSGLNRPGAIAQFAWPRFSTRIGLGIELPLAHAVVDRLLGFEREPAEGRLQISPVEWGILSFVMARALNRLDGMRGPFGGWDLELDRVGPDPFDPVGLGLGPIVTVRCWTGIGRAEGSARLWLPESLLAHVLAADPPEPSPPTSIDPYADLASDWKAEAGAITMPRGLAKLRPGLLLLIDGAPLSGTPASPDGPIELSQDEPTARSSLYARAVPDSHAGRLVLLSPLRRVHRPRETLAMLTPAESTPGQASPSESTPTIDLPVTLVVELGRVSLPLRQLASLQPGDVVDLGRHPKDPVELTSGGRLIARGELVQVDTELGVRVTQVFL